MVGLTQTNVCADAGDSGGPFLVGTQAQGLLSGADVRGCFGGGNTSFYQPVIPVLQAFGLSLLTRFGPMPA